MAKKCVMMLIKYINFHRQTCIVFNLQSKNVEIIRTNRVHKMYRVYFLGWISGSPTPHFYKRLPTDLGLQLKFINTMSLHTFQKPLT